MILMRKGCNMIRNELTKYRGTFIPGESGKLCLTLQTQAILVGGREEGV